MVRVTSDAAGTRTNESKRLFERAARVIPGGVNSPVRAFKAVGGGPLFIGRAAGSRLFDADGNAYIDYVGSWGPLILGHADPAVLEAIGQAAGRGTTYGAPHEGEIRLAELIVEAVPSMEMVRLVSSGTEATMSAIRLARAFTGRDRIVKFDGCYHGHADMLLAKGGSGLLTFGLPDSAGVPEDAVRHTLVANYNDLPSVEALFAAHGADIAAVIVEPIAGNMGVVPPAEGFLEGLRRITRAHDSLLIFDEVITGFRVAPGGAQSLLGVTPDLTCLGKIIGGGMPVGAYGGPSRIMSLVAPSGPVYQAGTLSGNPVATAAGITTLERLRDGSIHRALERKAAALCQAIAAEAERAGLPVTLNRVGSMFTLFFTARPVVDWASARLASTERYGAWFRAMLGRGIYLPPSQFEAAFLSAAHSDADLEETVDAVRRSLED